MTWAILAGALVGVGGYLLVRALFPPRPGLSERIAAFDALRREEELPPVRRMTGERVGRVPARVGAMTASFYAARGWQVRSVRADLSLLDKSYERFLATKVLLAAAALVFIPLLAGYVAVLGFGISIVVPIWMGIGLAVLFFFLPDLQLRREAATRRRDFRHALSAYLDLVAMSMAGGRGVPEALLNAAAVGDGWVLWRIRDVLASARMTGTTPWQALGDLGDEVNVDELRDLSAALTLVADDGARVRQSLTARAAGMRSRELSDLEGKAGEQSQSMLVAQLLLCAGFLLFLAFPAVMHILAA